MTRIAHPYRSPLPEDEVTLHEALLRPKIGLTKNGRDLTNVRLNALVAVEKDNTDDGTSRWICRCDCGNYKSILTGNFIRGLQRSCGCRKVANMNRDKCRCPHCGETKPRDAFYWHHREGQSPKRAPYCTPCSREKQAAYHAKVKAKTGRTRKPGGLVVIELREQLSEACDRLFDMLLGDDGEAWLQAERFLKQHRPDLYNRIGMNLMPEPNPEPED